MRRVMIICALLLSVFTTVAWGATDSATRSRTTQNTQRSSTHRSHHMRTKGHRRRGNRHPAKRHRKTTHRNAAAGATNTTASKATPVLFGDGKVESNVDLNAAGLAEAFPFLASSSGTASSITVYVDSHNTAKTLIAGLYTNANGHPGTLLSTGSLGSLTPRAWNTVDVKSTAVSVGNQYWVVVLGTGGTFWFRDRANGPCESENSAQSNLTALPSAWSDGPSWSTCPLSAYVSGTVSTTSPSAPNNTTAPKVSGTPTQGDTLTTSNGSWGGSPTGFSYAWKDCDRSGNYCTAITGATSSSYTLTSGDTGHTIRSIVTATNSGGSSTAASTQTATVAGAAPAPPWEVTAPTITGTAQQGDMLTANYGTWSGGTPMTYTCSWSDGGSGYTHMLGASDVGHTVSVTVTATNAAGTATASSTQTAMVTAAPVAPSNTSAPTITGTPQQGDTLTAHSGTWSGDTPMSYTYAWSDGTTGATDTLGASDVGQTITVTVTATNDGGSANAASTATPR